MSDLQRLPEPTADSEVHYPGFGRMFLIWTAIGIFSSLRHQLLWRTTPDIGDLSFMIAYTACFYPWIVFTPLVFRIEKRFPLGTSQWARNLALLTIASVPVCLLSAPSMTASFRAALVVLNLEWKPLPGFAWMREIFVAQAIFWCSIAAGYFIRTLFQLRAQEYKTARLALEKSQLETGLREAQLDVLRARLNPHFLFNSLQNISVMTKQDPQMASRMLTRLGDLLRAVLRQDSQPESTLQEEIELTRAYVALEQMRFGERLQVYFEIGPDLHSAMVPCFVLQPLIENAIVHGLRGTRKTGVIAVSAVRQGGELVLGVTDNGIGLPDESLSEVKIGVGLGSTRDRLATMYPDRHTFAMQRLAEGGTEVRIAIPLRFAEYADNTSNDEQPAVADR